MFTGLLNAQLCTGSLGDPVVNITFGTGNVNYNSIPGFSTNYTYLNTVCPNDGQYTIASSSPNCFGNNWWALTEDHTSNDINGNMMIVNASYNPGDFCVDTVDGLCNGVTYEFAAWLLNLMNKPNSILPNITFSIETTTGIVIQQYQTGDIPFSNGPVWKQHGFFFTAPANSGKIVLRLRNNASGGNGNDIAIDDITFRPCGPKVSLNSSSGSNIIDDCENDATFYIFNGNVSSGYNNIQYQWQQSSDKGHSWIDITGATNRTYSPLHVIGYIMYRLTIAEGTSISISNCRIASDTILYNRHSFPKAGIIPFQNKCTGDSVIINADRSNRYQWTGPLTFNSNQSSFVIKNLSLLDSGKYFAHIVSPSGCIGNDTFHLQIKQRPVAIASSDTGICQGQSIRLQAHGGETYRWKPTTYLNNHTTDSVITITPSDSIKYILYAGNNNCFDSTQVQINVWKSPTAFIMPVIPIYEGYSVLLNGEVTGTDIQYYWNPNNNIYNANTLNPTVNPDSSTIYYLIANSVHNCGEATDSVIIKVYKMLHIPNAFSPNGDGINDYWTIGNIKAYPLAEVKLFNLNGALIFNTTGNYIHWDGTISGTPVPVGTYFYMINLHENQPIYSGWLEIIR